MGALRCLIGRFLDVHGDDDNRRGPAGQSGSDCPVGHVPKLSRRIHLLHICGDIREDAIEVQLLLVASATHGRFRLSANREDRHVVESGIVEAGQ
jgi:hypothetical protein